MHNYIKCKRKLDIPESVTKKLDIEWDGVTFLVEMIGGKAGEFLIRDTGQLCHNRSERENIDASQAGQPGVIWGGSGYCKVTSYGWEPFSYTGDAIAKVSILADDADADIKVKFEFENGYVTNHEVNTKMIDNTLRKQHDKKIKEFAIKRVKKMNTRPYRFYDSCIRKPIICVCRGFGYTASFVQDVAWKIERKLNK